MVSDSSKEFAVRVATLETRCRRLHLAIVGLSSVLCLAILLGASQRQILINAEKGVFRSVEAQRLTIVDAKGKVLGPKGQVLGRLPPR